jgi:hypothetical protein
MKWDASEGKRKRMVAKNCGTEAFYRSCNATWTLTRRSSRHFPWHNLKKDMEGHGKDADCKDSICLRDLVYEDDGGNHQLGSVAYDEERWKFALLSVIAGGKK